MRIIFDFDFNLSDGSIVGRHFIETTPGDYPKFTHPLLGAAPLDVMQIIKAYHLGTIPIGASGWDIMTKHPGYPGKTRLEALVGEIIRLNDTAARTVLGV